MNDEITSLRDKLDDQKNYRSINFIKDYATEVEMSAPKWIVALASDEFSEKTFSRLWRLAFFIFVEGSKQYHNRKLKRKIDKKFNVNDVLKGFQVLMYKFYVFKALRIPFSRWEYLAKETCKYLVNCEGKVTENEEKKELLEKIYALEREVAEEDKQLYCDYLNGAL